MPGDNQNIGQLLEKLDLLLKKQEAFQNEINQLKSEINSLKHEESPMAEKPPATFETKVVVDAPEVASKTDTGLPHQKKPTSGSRFPAFTIKQSWERFIGENLINKIGIIITVIGAGIGAKYSIEHQLISPLTRIILGYLLGIALLGFGIKLKQKYEHYSAVLVSGAMAILYFITFAAYDFYTLISQTVAFSMMVVFTVFTVVAALSYNRQVIAVIGLVGSYAVPFLLSDESGNHIFLLSYISLINAGILIIAFKKYWKPVFYCAFGLTWLIFFSWYLANFRADDHLTEALVFATLYFLIFYFSFLSYKLIREEKYNKGDVVLLLLNSFIYFGLGYGILNDHDIGSQFLGLFTLANAIIHFAVCTVVYRKKLADRNLFYLIAGLVLVFITIAIPVQLDGNWVTLLWAGEAALLFWIGRAKGVVIYEQLAHPLILLAFASLLQDWSNPGISLKDVKPFFNIQLLSSLIFTGAFAGITWVNFYKKYKSQTDVSPRFWRLFNFIIPAIFLLAFYGSFLIEITNFFDKQYLLSLREGPADKLGFASSYIDGDIRRFKIIWTMNYTLLFLSLLAFINTRKIKNLQLQAVNLVLNFLTILIFLTTVLIALGDLRESYLTQHLANYYERGPINLYIRYISFGFVALLFLVSRQSLDGQPLKPPFNKLFELVLHSTIIWVLSSELLHWMDILVFEHSYKLGLSILWGIYALWLVILGIWKNKKHLRVVGIFLFAITLCKLFFYDIAHLNTIKKTIVFVSLGILLLIISFLYNKYKDRINDDES
ncbi:DUF2339 domain-containing protein [Fulvivirgaceae bacterium BMA12]|uniref:DUF2339 domain-containing protein n=1 Tax=Agaribacillus aureus TaxID=3051825 RepID=A0ABT8L183_9BACT|nr:DUF2339 domain-containing protein [Fulvivirgaceae bacterium BMA12]